ncbi:hypothetical protein OSB04_023883 [Centaurea solstitialis]|uniref:CCHC-type domain-containing protein n=1 Tax=Centaurea solstitialis TaxID=347529 RepID=A0AA38WDC6_9ASTR|nr:hypothetical protein OSB04_023883 [Centaurea solstitialis]
MNNMEKTIAELHSMLKTAELNMGAKNKTKDVPMAVQNAPKVRENGKGKGKGKKVKPNRARTKNRCFTCNEVGHWRQNCPKRHEADFRKKSLVYTATKESCSFTLHVQGNWEFFQGSYLSLDVYQRVLLSYKQGQTRILSWRGNEGTLHVGTSSQQQVVEPTFVEPQQKVTKESDIQPPPVCMSDRVRHAPERYSLLISDGDDSQVDLDEPISYQETMAGPKAAKWKEAMESEMQSMYDNQVWDLVDHIPSLKIMGNKCVFKKKTDMDGKVHTYIARLVAKGYTQTHGVDYDETFSLVAMLKSIRILIAITTFHDYEIWQMDVKIAFLNGKLSEDVYMTQPEGFVQSEHPNRVCKLQKSIYGLKQASRSWNICFDEKIKEFVFLRSEDEPCVYVRTSVIVVFLVLYVDGILLMGNDIPTLQSVKTWLGKCFSMKDMGDAAYILGIKIYRDRSRRLIGLSQSTYIDKVLKKFNMQDSKKGFIPMQHGLALSKACPSSSSELERMSRIPYASAIGSIMYAMICTRPDVSCALSMTSRYQANPGNDHWTAVKNILKYLRRTKEMFLVYGGAEELSRSSKQSTVADSTTEAEYIAVNEAAKEAVWMKKFIEDLGVVPSIQDPIEIFCDNEGVVILAKEPRSHKHTRHILRKFHYVRKVVEDKDIIISRVGTDGNLADPFTKPLSQTKHDAHTRSIGIRFASDLA